MRNGSKFGKSLEIYSLFTVEGMNLDNLVNTLVKKGIAVKNVKKIGNKKISFAIKSADVKKFFAISKDLCYTKIKRVREYGNSYPVLFFYKNFGLVLGALIFVTASLLLSGFVFGFSFTGTGSICSREVKEYLRENGIKPFTDLSGVDLSKLSDGILTSNPRLTFAECKKVGFTLKIQLALAENGDESSALGESEKLVSTLNGVVCELKVYRGTPTVAVGDCVKKGDVLVDGFATVKDQTVSVSVIAYAVIKTETVSEYISDNDGEEERAVMFAENKLDGKEICESTVSKIFVEGKFVYRVKTAYKTVLYSR